MTQKLESTLSESAKDKEVLTEKLYCGILLGNEMGNKIGISFCPLVASK